MIYFEIDSAKAAKAVGISRRGVDNCDTRRYNESREQRILVSIVLVTYNSSWERVRVSLNSALRQKGIDFEIVVSDDGSQNNHFDKIESLFKKYSFTNYRLISHDKNQGTVLNFLDAVEQSRGGYIRGLGQGDMFFDEYTVRDSYESAVATDADVLLSKTVCYLESQGAVELFKSSWTVQKEKLKALGARDYILLYRYPVHGAATFYKRDTLIVYLKELAGHIKYAEDIAIRFMALDGRNVSFSEKNTVYYEYGTGISSSGVPAMMADEKAFIDLFLTRRVRCPHSHWLEKFKLLLNVEREGKFALPYLDRETTVALLLKKSPAVFMKKYEILKGIEAKYQGNLSFMDKVRRRLALLSVPEAFFYLLRARFFSKKMAMTDTNVPTSFAELCLSRE